MSTASEISRLQAARNTIRNKLITFGLAESTDLLDDLADAIDNISYQGAITASVQEGDTYTIPAGYHNGSGTVTITLEEKTTYLQDHNMLYNTLGTTWSALVGLGMIVFQYCILKLWSKNHERGPLEGLWRRLTWIGA